jgi:hypothetical protein
MSWDPHQSDVYLVAFGLFQRLKDALECLAVFGGRVAFFDRLDGILTVCSYNVVMVAPAPDRHYIVDRLFDGLKLGRQNRTRACPSYRGLVYRFDRP